MRSDVYATLLLLKRIKDSQLTVIQLVWRSQSLPGKKSYEAALKPIFWWILYNIRDISGCQSVGIRLQKGKDFPYYVNEGFPEFFVLRENSLLVKTDKGNPVINKKSRSLLECMCGNVINGAFNPDFSFFTEKGSFWTNSTTKFLSNITMEEEQSVGPTRNMCHNSGYESTALIPIRTKNRTLGLIQLNDPRENMFTLEKIKMYESISQSIGTLLVKALDTKETLFQVSCMINKSSGN